MQFGAVVGLRVCPFLLNVICTDLFLWKSQATSMMEFWGREKSDKGRTWPGVCFTLCMYMQSTFWFSLILWDFSCVLPVLSFTGCVVSCPWRNQLVGQSVVWRSFVTRMGILLLPHLVFSNFSFLWLGRFPKFLGRHVNVAVIGPEMLVYMVL